MLWFIIAGIVVIATCVGVYLKEKKRYTRYRYYYSHPIEDTLFATLFTIIAAGFGAFIANVACMPATSVMKPSYSQELQNIRDTSTTSGSFFLGSGSFNEHPAFFYYAKKGNSFWLNHISADAVTLVESAGATPKIECSSSVTSNKWLSLVSDNKRQCTITIPPGSIKQNFNLG
jgi:hypothetical protein